MKFIYDSMSNNVLCPASSYFIQSLAHLLHEIENKNFIFFSFLFFGHDPIKGGSAFRDCVVVSHFQESRLPPLQQQQQHSTYITQELPTIFITPKMVTAAQYQMVVMALWLRRPRGQMSAGIG
jgi:hypothetical protein